MFSDESSSDSETGRFKCQTQSQDGPSQRSKFEDSSRSAFRNRHLTNDLHGDNRKDRGDSKDCFDRYSTSRSRFPRHSPVRRRYSRERSSGRRSHDQYRHDRRSKSRTKHRDRSNSRDRRQDSRSRSKRSIDCKREVKNETRSNILTKEKSPERRDKRSMSRDMSPLHKSKRSEVCKPRLSEQKKKKTASPIPVEEHSDESDNVQPGSYYNMIPAVVKEKSEESSEIDSSDDEKLRAKLLNLEKELHKSRKKKHKKRHKKKQSKSKEREQDTTTEVEVSSTTDITKDKVTVEHEQTECIEVSSTQKTVHKDSGEEGEILSDDSANTYEINPNDLRHKLKRSLPKSDGNSSVCGPILPPHLDRHHKLKPVEREGPVLPPHLQNKPKRLGPSIPDDLRLELSKKDYEIIKYTSSDEDAGIGPLPAGSEERWSEAHERLEERALDIKIKRLDVRSVHKSEVKSREQWMLELPEGKAKYLGLEARSFRPKEGPDMSDRSSWTDTPEQKALKAAGIKKEEDPDETLRREAQARQISNRDKEQEEAVKKHKKKHKREESLLEIHEKKLKKKKKKDEKEEDKKERRPFSRDVDLQVNRFDEAQKRSIIKKAQDLDSRFSRGQAKFL
ncbi:hypothetical protein ACJJTC_007805 [Scirpophaga incertulas]